MLGLFSYRSGSVFNCGGGSVLSYHIYKLSLKNIFKDLKEVKKRLQDIDILVCWTVEYERVNEFVQSEGIVLKKVDQSENYFYGVTHEVAGLGRNTNFLPIIELKTVLNMKLNLVL